MKPLALLLLLLALLSPSPARADARARRLEVAGIALSTAGGAIAVGGASLLGWAALHPPQVDVYFCARECNFAPSNEPLVAGAALLGAGVATLGTGIALIVVGKHQERATIALSAGALRVRF